MNKIDRKKEVDRTIRGMFIWTIIILIALLVGYLLTGNKISLFASLGGLILILIYTFRIKNYDPKLFYVAFLGITIIQGALLTYLYLFEPIYLKNPLFYGITAIFIFFVIYFVYYYLKRGRYSKLPWK